jgi:hypothetical protein
MGTNYYIKDFEDPDDDPGGWHVGKKSVGHEFCWADPPEVPTVIDGWLKFAWENSELKVFDEYGKEAGGLWEFVSARKDSDLHNPGKGWC